MPMLYAELNAAGAADLVFWSADELTRYADQELSRLTGGLVLFTDARDVAGIAGQSAYDLAHTTNDAPLDTRFISLIHAAWSGSSLSPMNMREVEARDANWTATTAIAPTNWIGDWLATGFLMAYPQPTQNGTLTVFCQRNAPTLATGATALPAPDALADLLHLRVLADARSKRSDAWMPEAAALSDQIADLMEKVFQAYYGSAM